MPTIGEIVNRLWGDDVTETKKGITPEAQLWILPLDSDHVLVVDDVLNRYERLKIGDPLQKYLTTIKVDRERLLTTQQQASLPQKSTQS